MVIEYIDGYYLASYRHGKYNILCEADTWHAAFRGCIAMLREAMAC